MTAVDHAPLAGAVQPRQLIVTLYGLYARDDGGRLSVAALVRLLAGLGVEEAAVRSSISRLKRRGLLAPDRRDGSAGYVLTPAARQILDDGDARIFGRRRATAADGWVLVVFSVPESEREKRHALRSQLHRLGFGTAAPGVWIAPGHLADEVIDVLRRLGLDGYVQVFRGEHLAFEALSATVGEWWDLDGLRDLYAAFLDRHRPVRARWSRRRTPDGAAAFADYVRLVTDWRRLPYADPGLPPHLLPARWNGVRAAELFAELADLLAEPARVYARELIAGGDTATAGR
ncbi:PaaX family transcriptional regulator [Pseudonocardia xinjiangensis]|uniref:PaaX family transcriptional regulator n=1 Tax=Pseudonocardia xinjiangensis TaxID=75289 RepID=A0ABX1RK98_9PSEU|nr:PaaX family transcriptional regulator C-terminal domain-containing protein [Pseudonocardia xinjiangensis]NMH80802.1 PaaX family transcriptional regulator [Pseudonocardia xinjiangensis]